MTSNNKTRCLSPVSERDQIIMKIIHHLENVFKVKNEVTDLDQFFNEIYNISEITKDR